MRHSRVANAYRRGLAAARHRLKVRLDGPKGDAAATAAAGDPSRNGSSTVVPDAEVWPLRELFGGRFGAPEVSYTTVRDYAESVDAMPFLAAASPPPLAAQRGWAIKALLGAVEPGSRILELAGSGPLAAGVLSRLDYEVTVVDPFDGTANEPHRYVAVTRDYPRIEFVRDQFPPTGPLPGAYAAVYSAGLIDRIAPDRVAEVIAAAAAALEPGGGVLAHSFSHVIAGWGVEESRDRLQRLAEAAGIDSALLDEQLAPMADDPETYLVSAETHDAWRGSLPYETYPMRRIGSVNVLTRVAA